MRALLWTVIAVAAVGSWLNGVFQDRRAEPKPDTDGPERLDTTDEADPLGVPFKDFQASVAEILDRNPQRRDELRRELNAATELYEEAEFNAVIKPLKRDRAFLRSIEAAEADGTQT